MKFENNNKEIIKKITNRSLKSNKASNSFDDFYACMCIYFGNKF